MNPLESGPIALRRRALPGALLIVLSFVPAASAAETPDLDLPRLSADAATIAEAAPRRRATASEAKAQPCPEQGPGFVRMPGSATCLRLSGRAAGGIAVRSGRDGTAARPEADGRFALDARTDTDLGPLRTYVRVGTGRR